MWNLIDFLGYLAGPLWPDWLDGLLDCLSSWPDMIDACGVQCAVSDTLSYLLWVHNGYQTIDCSGALLTFLLGMCE